MDAEAQHDRIELTVREAATAGDVSDKTIRRHLTRFPGAYRRDSPAGSAKGQWMIPIADLVGAGFTIEPRRQTRAAPTLDADGLMARIRELTLEADLLREMLGEIRVRAELAETLAEERRIALEALRQSVRPNRTSQPNKQARKGSHLPPENPANTYFDALPTSRSDPRLPFGEPEV